MGKGGRYTVRMEGGMEGKQGGRKGGEEEKEKREKGKEGEGGGGKGRREGGGRKGGRGEGGGKEGGEEGGREGRKGGRGRGKGGEGREGEGKEGGRMRCGLQAVRKSNALIFPLPSPDTAPGSGLWKPVEMLPSQRSPTSIEMHHEGGEQSPGSTDSHTLTGASITTARVGVRGGGWEA